MGFSKKFSMIISEIPFIWNFFRNSLRFPPEIAIKLKWQCCWNVLWEFLQEFLPEIPQGFLQRCLWTILLRFLSWILLIFSLLIFGRKCMTDCPSNLFKKYWKSGFSSYSIALVFRKISSWMCPWVSQRMSTDIPPGAVFILFSHFSIDNFLIIFYRESFWNTYREYVRHSSKDSASTLPRKSFSEKKNPWTFPGIWDFA